MKVKTITYDNAIVKVHMPEEIDTERLKEATVKFMLGVIKEKESEVVDCGKYNVV